MQDFFITPIGGLAWNVGEDAIDRFILSHVRHARRNKWLLLASSLTTPGKSAANIARFRAPYYRDYDLETAGELVQIGAKTLNLLSAQRSLQPPRLRFLMGEPHPRLRNSGGTACL